MSSVLGLAVGLILGVCTTRNLRQQTQRGLFSARAEPGSGFMWGSLVRLATVSAVLTVLIVWSPVAMLVALLGYWLARTTYLVKCHDFI